MSQDEKQTGREYEIHEAMESQIPPWAMPLIRISDVIYPWCLSIAGLLLVFMLSLLFVGRVDFDWLFRVREAFLILTGVGFLALLTARYSSFAPGWIGLCLGFAVHYGCSFFLIFLAGHGKVDLNNEFFLTLGGVVKNIGLFLGTTSIVRLAIGYTIYFSYHREHMRVIKARYMDTSRVDTQKPAVVPKCWQMSRCRPGVRMTCPNFIDRIPCWKRRSGCFCDRDLADYLVSSTDHKDVQEVIDMQANKELAKTPTTSAGMIRERMKRVAKSRPWKLQKRLCFECPLYLEHQDYKQRNLSWISFVITAGLVAALYPLFDFGYKWSATQLDVFLKKLIAESRLPENFTPDAASSLVNSPFEYVILVVFGLLLMAYVLEFVETMFMKWKW